MESRILDLIAQYKFGHINGVDMVREIMELTEKRDRKLLLEFHKSIIPDDVMRGTQYTREDIVGAFLINNK